MSQTRTLLRLSHIARHMQSPKPCLTSSTRSLSSAAQAVLATRKSVPILDSNISYLDTGKGNNVVIFLHGNPTAAYLWRNIIPHVQPIARCLAPDLIGMGHSGKEPNNNYKFADHYKYLCAWIDAMKLPQKLSFVIHDWGSGLGFHWCNQNPDRVESITYMEALVGPVPGWDAFPGPAKNVFQALRTPAGEEMVLKKNFFVERLLPGAILRNLSDEEMGEYRRPYTEPGESRRPTLTWPREIPVAGDGPQDVLDIAMSYNMWLRQSRSIPKLYIDAEPGFFAPGIRQAVKDWPNQKVVKVKGSHFVQEDSPDEIGQALKDLLTDIYNKK